MTNKLISTPVLCGLLAVNFLFFSCGGEQKEVVLDEEVTTDTLNVDTKASLGSISVNIPSPIEITGEISGAGFSFKKDILNSTSKASGYSTNYQKALNRINTVIALNQWVHFNPYSLSYAPTHSTLALGQFRETPCRPAATNIQSSSPIAESRSHRALLPP